MTAAPLLWTTSCSLNLTDACTLSHPVPFMLSTLQLWHLIHWWARTSTPNLGIDFSILSSQQNVQLRNAN
jgi:hypothetical protein